jgi:hypothetical protein
MPLPGTIAEDAPGAWWEVLGEAGIGGRSRASDDPPLELRQGLPVPGML